MWSADKPMCNCLSSHFMFQVMPCKGLDNDGVLGEIKEMLDNMSQEDVFSVSEVNKLFTYPSI